MAIDVSVQYGYTSYRNVNAFLFTKIQHCNIVCLLDYYQYKPFLYKDRCTIIITVYNYKPILLCT